MAFGSTSSTFSAFFVKGKNDCAPTISKNGITSLNADVIVMLWLTSTIAEIALYQLAVVKLIPGQAVKHILRTTMFCLIMMIDRSG